MSGEDFSPRTLPYSEDEIDFGRGGNRFIEAVPTEEIRPLPTISDAARQAYNEFRARPPSAQARSPPDEQQQQQQQQQQSSIPTVNVKLTLEEKQAYDMSARLDPNDIEFIARRESAISVGTFILSFNNTPYQYYSRTFRDFRKTSPTRRRDDSIICRCLGIDSKNAPPCILSRNARVQGVRIWSVPELENGGLDLIDRQTVVFLIVLRRPNTYILLVRISRLERVWIEMELGTYTERDSIDRVKLRRYEGESIYDILTHVITVENVPDVLPIATSKSSRTPPGRTAVLSMPTSMPGESEFFREGNDPSSDDEDDQEREHTPPAPPPSPASPERQDHPQRKPKYSRKRPLIRHSDTTQAERQDNVLSDSDDEIVTYEDSDTRLYGDRLPNTPPPATRTPQISFKYLLAHTDIHKGTQRVGGTVFIENPDDMMYFWRRAVGLIGKDGFDVACFTSPLQWLKESYFRHRIPIPDNPRTFTLRPMMCLFRHVYVTVFEDEMHVWITLIVPEGRYTVEDAPEDYVTAVELYDLLRVEQERGEPTYMYGMFRLIHIHWYNAGILRLLRTMIFKLSMHVMPTTGETDTIHKESLNLTPFVT
jgi:hypothetical protein